MPARQNGHFRPGRPLLGLAAIVGVCAVPAQAAGAATVSRSGNTITLTSDDAADHITGSGPGSDRLVTFTAVDTPRITAGPGCRVITGSGHRPTNSVSCGKIARQDNPLTLNARLGGGDDSLQLNWRSDRQPRLVADGGEGNDTISGTILSDDISGGPGDDRLYGADDIDNLNGGPGSDVIQGGNDGDHLVGGPGVDRLYGDGDRSTGGDISGWAGGDTIDGYDTPSLQDLAAMTPDQILALHPEPDAIDCGTGYDVVNVDAADVVAASCPNRTGDQATPLPDITDQLPFEAIVSPRPNPTMANLNRGIPLRFTVVPSAHAFATTRLDVSPATARRYHLKKTIIAATRPVNVTGKLPADLYIRTDWSTRDGLDGAHRVRVILTVNFQWSDGAALHDAVVHEAITLS